MILNSIRWKLQTWHGLILVVVLAGFGVTAYQVARDNQQRRIDDELAQQLGAALRPRPERPPQFGELPPGGPGPGRPMPRRDVDRRAMIRDAIGQIESSNLTNAFYFILWNADGTVFARTPNAPDTPRPASPDPATLPPRPPPGAPVEPAEGGPAPRPIARTRDSARELYRFLPSGDCILVGRSMAMDVAAMRRLSLWLAAAGAGVLLLGLAGGWWVASRAIRPVDEISATALKISSGDLSQRISAAETESELGRLVIVLNTTFARLEAAFAHQARFTSDASHELRTPISVILSQCQTTLSRDRSAPEYREALEACHRAAQRMRQLVESLLQLARLDAGQESIRFEPFDLSRVTNECIDLVSPLAREKGIRIESDITAVQCLGNADRIGQVVTNLLTNAIHFNRDQGEVRVSLRLENGSAQLTVADTGEGIEAADLPHIFERFYRADKSRSRAQGRSGLGLAICKSVVDAHGGTISVSSEKGAGATFVVKLPVK